MDSNVKSKLTHIGKDRIFNEIFKKLTNDNELSNDEKTYILTTSILFFKQFESNNKYLSYADIAYYIVLKYSIKYSDYQPLFDFSINFGFYPIAKSILNENLLNRENMIDSILDLRLKDYITKDNYVETLEQNIQSNLFLEDTAIEKSYLAPTSFGKSSLIIDYINEINKSPERKLKIVIVVPTKSLLMQTYRMVRNANLKRKILIHDEMYQNEDSFIAVFTQERSLRLLNKSGMFFDVLIIDEAHNLLKKDRGSNRNILLARLIAKNKTLNINQRVIYLSPLIDNVDKLRINKTQKITSHNIRFNIKEPEFYEYTLKKEIYKYNRFVNQFYRSKKNIELSTLIEEYSKEKNFVYNTSPRKIEDLAKTFYEEILNVKINSPEIDEIIKTLSTEVHESFYAIKYLEKGVIYLHGRIPNLIKEYLEEKFKNISQIKYIIANSVILEGMNLPIDNLFIFSTWSLKGKELINLVGRVNRLNTIFTKDKFFYNKLLPQVFIINSTSHKTGHNPVFNNHLRSRVFNDIVENPLLDDFDIENLKISDKKRLEKEIKRIKQIKSNEEFLYTEPKNDFERIKHSFIEADIYTYYSDFDTMINNFLSKRNNITNGAIPNWNEKEVLEKLKYLFIDDLKIIDFEFSRLENQKARNYYSNYIYINRKNSFNERVNTQLKYFNERAESPIKDDRLYYIGETYGDTFRYSDKYPETKKKVYVNLKEKKEHERVNLAIVKLKMEDDFISFKLNKFIVLMHDYKLITNDEYNLFVYGTISKKNIELTKYGLNINLVNRLEKDNQIKNIEFDSFNNLTVNQEFNNYLNTLSDFQKFELRRYF